MNNIFNVRVMKLIKKELLEYGKYLFCFLGFAIIVPVVLNRLFGTSGQILFANFGNGELNFNIGDIGNISIEGVFSFVSFAFFTFFMFIGGITVGAELPQSIRWGIARKEYFTATIVSAAIVSLAFAPLMLLLNSIINLLVASGSAFYNSFHIGDGNTSILVMQFLAYIVLFLLGYCIPLTWQRFGWQIGLAFIFALVALIFIFGFLGLNTIIIGFSTFDIMTTDDYLFLFQWDFVNGTFGISGIIGLITIVVLGTGAFMLTKDVPVKVV